MISFLFSWLGPRIYRTWSCLCSSSCPKTRTYSFVRVVSNLCWTSASVWPRRNRLNMPWKWSPPWWNSVFHRKQRNSSTPSLHALEIYVRHSPVRENVLNEPILHLHGLAFHVDEYQFIHELFLRLIHEKVSDTGTDNPLIGLCLEPTWMSINLREAFLGRVDSLVLYSTRFVITRLWLIIWVTSNWEMTWKKSSINCVKIMIGIFVRPCRWQSFRYANEKRIACSS